MFNVILGKRGAIFQKYDIQNAASSTLMIFLQPNVLWVLPMTVHTKLLFGIELSRVPLKLNKTEIRLNFNIVANGYIANILEIVNRRAKQREIWDSGVLVRHI